MQIIKLKTKIDISISLLINILGLVLFLPAFFSEFFSQTFIGKIWITATLLLIILGLLKIEQVQITENTITKRNFIFCRTIELIKIKHYKIKVNNLNIYPQYNIAAILKIFRDGYRYSNFRIMTIYFDGKRRMKIDERTMPISDFKKILTEIKKTIKST